ncbi:NAD(P)/FAD-dependent oxidoreductase [Microbacterium sp. LWO14-1.2]|uniref:NAD(P)/FAD-dependent oxidoreductase n=1 Tax=Microbacterium sp. LWO14-1.2 TaxID=3135263 RepID=UPI003139E35D
MAARDRVVVVGASISGLTAAETLRLEGFEGAIVLLGDEQHLPYTRPPLSKQILAREWEPDDARIRTSEELAAHRIEVRLGCAATGLDVGARVLETTAGPLAFDELVIATGTAPRPHPALPDALTLRTMDDALALRDRMDRARSIAVVGSGILGSEIASVARKHDAETLLIGRSGTLSFGGVGDLLTTELAALHEEHGVELALRAGIRSAERHGPATRLRFDDGGHRDVDLVVTMIGGTPRTDWLRDSSLDVVDGVACDADGVAAPGVWAVGDVAAWADPATGRRVRIEHQSFAIEQAIAVGTRLAHGDASPRPVPLFWSEVHGTRIHAYGWFDPRRPLADATPDEETRGRVYASHDSDGGVRGIVGWNATPRAFRTARAAVVAAPHDSTPHTSFRHASTQTA